MRKVFVSAFCLLLVSCASAYKPSARMTALQSSMSRSEAIEVVRQALRPSAQSVGLCGGVGTREEEKLEVTPTGFELDTYRLGEKVGEEKRYGQMYNLYKKEYYTETFEFDDVSKIRLMINNGRFCPGKAKGDYAFIVHFSMINTALLDVHRDELDRVLAAFKVLSPDINFIQGVGF